MSSLMYWTNVISNPDLTSVVSLLRYNTSLLINYFILFLFSVI